MTQDWTETHLKEIIKYQRQLDALPGDGMEMARIETLSKMLVLKLSAEFSERYKHVYASRKQVHAEAYGNMKRWGNAFDSTKEEVNALKYRVRISIEDGSSRRGS